MVVGSARLWVGLVLSLVLLGGCSAVDQQPMAAREPVSATEVEQQATAVPLPQKTSTQESSSVKPVVSCKLWPPVDDELRDEGLPAWTRITAWVETTPAEFEADLKSVDFAFGGMPVQTGVYSEELGHFSARGFYADYDMFRPRATWKTARESGTVECGLRAFGVGPAPYPAAKFLRLPIEEAIQQANADGIAYRIVRDGSMTFEVSVWDYDLNRVNFEVDEGFVTWALLG